MSQQKVERYLAAERHVEASKSKYVQVNKRLCALLPTYDNEHLSITCALACCVIQSDFMMDEIQTLTLLKYYFCQ